MNIPDNEQEWQKLVIANNYRCISCNERISFADRKLYAERRLCSECAPMINIQKDVFTPQM